MSIKVRIRNGLKKNPATGLGGANEGYIRGHLADMLDLSGGVVDLLGGHALVHQASPTPNLTVVVDDGIVYIPNSAFDEFDADTVKFWEAVIESEAALNIAANSSGLTRVDLICVYLNTATTPNEYASNIATLVVVQGTPGSGAPATPSNHYKLANVTITNGDTAIGNGDIADTRAQLLIKTEFTPGGGVATELVDSNGATVMDTVAATTPVNKVTVYNAATTKPVKEIATGTDSNINFILEGKGTGKVFGSFALRDGTVINGKFVVSVSSNNITIALKTLAGNDASADEPIYVNIEGTIRKVTAALAVTKNAGTNYFNSGSTEQATRAVDYFVYIGYNATDGVVIGFAKIPYGRKYSDFNTTNTNEKYCAISTISNAASSDAYVNIGRFEATLSATASFNWSVPTFDNANLIQYPIFETRVLTWAPVFTGFSAAPSGTISYILRGNTLIWSYADAGAGTSNGTGFTFTAPFLPLVGSALFGGPIQVKDNGVNLAATGHMQSTAATRAIAVYKSFFQGAFTGSGAKDMYFSGQSYLI